MAKAAKKAAKKAPAKKAPAKKAPAKAAKKPAAKPATKPKRSPGRPPNPNASPTAVAARRRKQQQRRREKGLDPEPVEAATDTQLEDDERQLAIDEDPSLAGKALSDRITFVDLAGQRALARWRIEKAKREKIQRLKDEAQLVPRDEYIASLEHLASAIRRACDSMPALLVSEESDPAVVEVCKPVLAKVARRIRESVHEIIHEHFDNLGTAADA